MGSSSVQFSAPQFSSGGMEGRAGALADRRPEEGSRARTRACGGGDLQRTPYCVHAASTGVALSLPLSAVQDPGLRASTREATQSPEVNPWEGHHLIVLSPTQPDPLRCAGPCLLVAPLALLTVTLGTKTWNQDLEPRPGTKAPTLGTCLIAGPWRSWTHTATQRTAGWNNKGLVRILVR